MKPFLTLWGIFILCSSLQGAVAEGENLLINGRFDAEQVDFPEFWSPSSAKSVLYDRVGGPEGKTPAVVLRGDPGTPGVQMVNLFDPPEGFDFGKSIQSGLQAVEFRNVSLDVGA